MGFFHISTLDQFFFFELVELDVAMAVDSVAFFLGQLGTWLTWSVPMLGWSYPTEKHTLRAARPFCCPMSCAGRSMPRSNPELPALALVPHAGA